MLCRLMVADKKKPGGGHRAEGHTGWRTGGSIGESNFPGEALPWDVHYVSACAILGIPVHGRYVEHSMDNFKQVESQAMPTFLVGNFLQGDPIDRVHDGGAP